MELDSEGWRNSKVWCFKIFEIPSLLKTMNQDVSCCCSSLTNRWVSLFSISWFSRAELNCKSTNHVLECRCRRCKCWGCWMLMSSQAPWQWCWSSLMSRQGWGGQCINFNISALRWTTVAPSHIRTLATLYTSRHGVSSLSDRKVSCAPACPAPSYVI